MLYKHFLDTNNLDKVLLRRCQILSKLSLHKNRPNPRVGALLFADKIISESWHNTYGQDHAERACLSTVSHDLTKGSMLYVSLEPCNHYGKTPPCTQIILDKQVGKVIVEQIDPNPQMQSKSFKFLKDNNIDVIHLQLNNQKHDRIFETNVKKERPYIVLKFAQSSNGYMDKNGSPIRISNAIMDRYVHKLRFENEAILIGHNTLRSDKPKLTNRHFYGKSPVKIVLTKSQINRILVEKTFDQKSKTIVLNSQFQDVYGEIYYEKINPNDDMIHLLHQIYKKYQITSILVEGGAKTIGTFLQENLWDEAIIITNEDLKIKSGTPSPQVKGRAIDTFKIRNNSIVKLLPN